MAEQVLPKRGAVYDYGVFLPSQANGKIFQTSATIASGDVKWSKAGAAFSNVTNLPSEIGTTGAIVGALTTSETDCDWGMLLFRDASGAQWCDVALVINFGPSLVGDLATQASVNALNNVSTAQVNAQVAAALATYDPPTRTEATSDATAILTAIGDIETGSGESAATIWTYADRHLTQSAASVIAAVTGSDLVITRAVTFSATLTGLSIPVSWEKIWFTLKASASSPDTAAMVQVVESNPGDAGDGLTYLAKAAAETAADGALTVNQGAGTIEIEIADSATAEMASGRGGYKYDLKALLADGTSVILTAGDAVVQSTPTAAIV